MNAFFTGWESSVLYPNSNLFTMAWQNLNSALLFSLTLQLHFPEPPRLFIGRGAFQQREIVRALKSRSVSYVPCIIHVSCRAVSVGGEEHQGQCDSVLLAGGSACAFPAVRHHVDFWIGVIGVLSTECWKMEESRECTFTWSLSWWLRTKGSHSLIVLW